LAAANPLKPSSCDREICILGACACVLRSEVAYQSSSLPGPNTMSLTLACDHRILYGADAAGFLGHIRDLLERPAALTL